MGCVGSTKANQTEFDFFQELTENSNVLICCGPLTQIGFTGPSLAELRKALMAIGCSSDYLDLYDHQVLDSGHMSVIMCAKHWIDHARSVGALAVAQQSVMWENLAMHMFKVACMSNNWDYKEVLNFVKTAHAVNKARGE